jgi:DedD protein
MMERRAKERLIGASILVVLIVLIVPELLSGPKPAAPVAEPQRLPAAASAAEPTRTVTVDLTTSKAPAQNATEAADAASAPPPPPAALTQPLTQPQPQPLPQSAPPQAFQPSQPPASSAAGKSAPANAPASPPAFQSPQHTAAVESAAPSPISRAGSPGRGEGSHASGWSVQLGSFASRANADNLARQLKGQGFVVYVLSGGSGAATRHRVRVGPLPDRDAAERTAAKLKTLGHASSLMPPGA